MAAGRYLGMTVPVVSHIHMMDGGDKFKKDVQTRFFLPAQFQSDPPRPADPEISIVHREPIRVVARSEPRPAGDVVGVQAVGGFVMCCSLIGCRTFFGTTTEETVSHQISLLWEIMGVAGELRADAYMVAVYENPGVACRRNEIWFIRRDL